MFVVGLLGGVMVVEGSKQSSNPACLCQIRGNPGDCARTHFQANIITARECTNPCTTSVERRWIHDAELVCHKPLGSTYTDNVQIVDDTIKHCTKQVHTHKQIPLCFLPFLGTPSAAYRADQHVHV